MYFFLEFKYKDQYNHEKRENDRKDRIKRKTG